MKKLLILSFLFLFACSKKINQNLIVNNFELNRYLGTWYEIARFDHFFEKNLYNVKTQYTLINKDKIGVENFGYNIKTKENKKIIGNATIKDSNKGQLMVSFFWPIRNQYNIILLDKNYNYAVVAGSNYKYLWILSRNKKIDKTLYQEILNKIQEMGFDINKLIYPIQIDD